MPSSSNVAYAGDAVTSTWKLATGCCGCAIMGIGSGTCLKRCTPTTTPPITSPIEATYPRRAANRLPGDPDDRSDGDELSSGGVLSTGVMRTPEVKAGSAAGWAGAAGAAASAPAGAKAAGVEAPVPCAA